MNIQCDMDGWLGMGWKQEKSNRRNGFQSDDMALDENKQLYWIFGGSAYLVADAESVV